MQDFRLDKHRSDEVVPCDLLPLQLLLGGHGEDAPRLGVEAVGRRGRLRPSEGLDSSLSMRAAQQEEVRVGEVLLEHVLLEAALLDDMGGEPQLRDGQQALEELALRRLVEVVPQDGVEDGDQRPPAQNRLQWGQVREGRGLAAGGAIPDCFGAVVEQRHRPEVGHALLVHKAQVQDEPAESRPVHPQAQAVGRAPRGLRPQLADQ
mmetsp:Transcript_17680/g.50401  ORF Transcript_17680/g.50401 Transcript_17680/m.50401 type:complete len:206 (-) Transcript_17680:39-656(-)